MSKEDNFPDQRKEILKIQFDYDLERHNMKMKELEFQRESDRLHHSMEMERQRIKTAEIRKDREYKANMRFTEGYAR